MTVKMSTVAQIQRAGQAIHDASESLIRDAQKASEHLNKTMSAAPHGPQADRIFNQWKNVARMAQDISQLEASLRNIYENSVLLAKTDDVEALAIPVKKHRKGSEAQDAVVLPEPAKAQAGKQRAKRRVEKKPASGAPREGNETKLMAYFATVLNSEELKQLHHMEITKATGIPSGSIAATIKRLVGKNLLEAGRRGALRLVSPPPAPVSSESTEAT